MNATPPALGGTIDGGRGPSVDGMLYYSAVTYGNLRKIMANVKSTSVSISTRPINIIV